MKIRSALALAAASTVAAVLVAAPAQAYDSDAMGYGATHMLQNSDLPSVLGTFRPGAQFTASQPATLASACYLKDTVVTFPKGFQTYQVGFSSKVGGNPYASESVFQYRSAEKAIAAFDALKKRVTSCDTTTTDGGTNDDGSTWSTATVTTHGVVPMVTQTGVESLFVNVNASNTGTAPEAYNYSNDSYSVFTLLDDVIIVTGYSLDRVDNLTKKQRKAVNGVAFTAIDRWLGEAGR